MPPWFNVWLCLSFKSVRLGRFRVDLLLLVFVIGAQKSGEYKYKLYKNGCFGILRKKKGKTDKLIVSIFHYSSVIVFNNGLYFLKLEI